MSRLLRNPPKLESKSFTFAAASVLALISNGAPTTARADNVPLEFHSAFPASARSRMLADLDALSDLQPTPGTTGPVFLGAGPGPMGPRLRDWFHERVHYAVWETFDVEHSLVRSKNSYTFPAPKTSGLSVNEIRYMPANIARTLVTSGNALLKGITTPEAAVNLSGTPVAKPEAPKDGPMGHGVLAANLAGVYSRGRENGVGIGLQWSPSRVIDYSSTRTGVMQIGSALYGAIDPSVGPAQALYLRFFRTSALMHEAHHSDGSGINAGFPHLICPITAPYPNEAACEHQSNGAYSVSEQFLGLAIDNVENALRPAWKVAYPRGVNSKGEKMDFAADVESVIMALQIDKADWASRATFRDGFYGYAIPITTKKAADDWNEVMKGAMDTLQSRGKLVAARPTALTDLLFKVSDFSDLQHYVTQVSPMMYHAQPWRQGPESATLRSVGSSSNLSLGGFSIRPWSHR